MEIKQLKELALKLETTEQESRILLHFYIIYNKGAAFFPILSAKINDQQQFKTNVEIAKSYFKSFIYD